MPLAGFKVRPLGSVPVVTVKVEAGKPVAVTLNVPAAPTTKVAVLTLTMFGGVLTPMARVRTTSLAPLPM